MRPIDVKDVHALKRMISELTRLRASVAQDPAFEDKERAATFTHVDGLLDVLGRVVRRTPHEERPSRVRLKNQ